MNTNLTNSKKIKGSKLRGYTLIELLLIISILGVLGSIVVPWFTTCLVRAREADVKKSLASIRSALSLHFAVHDGIYPDNLEVLTTDQRFLPNLPVITIPSVPASGNPGHRNISGEKKQDEPDEDAQAAWVYGKTGEKIGTVRVNCIHLDSRLRSWTSY